MYGNCALWITSSKTYVLVTWCWVLTVDKKHDLELFSMIRASSVDRRHLVFAMIHTENIYWRRQQLNSTNASREPHCMWSLKVPGQRCGIGRLVESTLPAQKNMLCKKEIRTTLKNKSLKLFQLCTHRYSL